MTHTNDNELPDVIPCYDRHGTLICWRPNFAKPGVTEAVERQVTECEVAANPPRNVIQTMLLIERLKRRGQW